MDTKTVFKYFTIMQYQAEAEYLRAMHRSGWRLVKLSGFCVYHFERCEPVDMIYRLDYNQDGIEHKDEYVQMFRDCGWEYLQDYVGYSYFRKPADAENGDEDIFCDDESRLQMISRIAKGRLMPMLILFFAVFTQLFLSISYGRTVFAIICTVILVLYAAIFACFGIQYCKFRKTLK